MSTRRLQTFARLALATTLATYLLILVGALVRASGAGLGCPDWPMCYGRWIPPTSVSQLPAGYDPASFNAILTWTEYTNRLLGVSIGLLITATLVAALRWHRSRPAILWPSVGAFLLVGFEGWLGGQVVRSGLQAWMISAHLLLALIIVTLLLYATFVAYRLQRGATTAPDAAHQRLTWMAGGTIALLLVQVWLGTLVRGGIEETVSLSPELARAQWLASVSTLDQVHRASAAIVALAVVSLMLQVRTRFTEEVRLIRWSTTAALLVAAQVIVGMVLGRMALPPGAQVLHLSLASLLLGALVVVALLAWDSSTEN